MWKLKKKKNLKREEGLLEKGKGTREKGEGRGGEEG
jgi:hypothetical protein